MFAAFLAFFEAFFAARSTSPHEPVMIILD